MADDTGRPDVDRFISDLERELRHTQVFQFLLDAFGIGGEGAKTLKAPFGDHVPQGSPIPADEDYVALSTYGFGIEIPNAEGSARMARACQPGGLERLREKTLAFSELAKNIWNGHGGWKRLAS